VRAKSEVLFVLGSALFLTPSRRLIPALALNAGLPRVFHHAQWVEAGGQMSYGFNFPQLWRSAANMVTARTAKALGIRIPESIRIRVDRWPPSFMPGS
jgi:hypothetical protein